jgi:hypothetical protein
MPGIINLRVTLLIALLSFFCVVSAGSASAASASATDERPDSSLPPPGVHPRIFFSPEDVPALKARVLNSASGTVAHKIADDLFAQRKGELESFAALDLSHPTADQIKEYFKADEFRNIAWGAISYDAFIHDDAAREALLAKVITNYARVMLASKELNEGGTVRGGTGTDYTELHNVWSDPSFNAGTSWLFGAGGFPVSYDVLFNIMTPDQRDVVRKAIAAATAGRQPFGWDAPLGRAFSNWYGYTGELAVMCAAIEGEEGYDEATYKRITHTIQKYFHVAYSDDGASHEDTYGPNLGLRAGSYAMLVMARRGEDLFATEKYHNFIKYYAEELQPFPGGNMVGGASGNGVVYRTSAIIAHYKVPNPVSTYVYRYIIGDDYHTRLPAQDDLGFVLFGTDWSGLTPATLAGDGLPLTVFYPERGKLITRTDWSPDALNLHFDARPDAFAIGHDTVDRGNFYINALGRAWTKLYFFRETSSSNDFSLVHIDGKAEPWKAPSVKFLWHGETDWAAGGAADLKYAYDWQWTPPWPAKDEKLPPPWEPEMSDPRTLGWPGNEDYIPHKLYGEEGIGHIGSYMQRRPYNPVLKAFRTASLIRGIHPYVLVNDDIQKDGQPHVYDWHLQLQTDLKLESTSGRDTILADPNDDRRLLVRALEAEGYQQSRLESYTVSTSAKGVALAGLHLILTSKTIEPKFKILLLPFRQGEALPTTTWNTDHSAVTLRWADGQTDQLDYSPDSTGRTQMEVRRGDQVMLQTH